MYEILPSEKASYQFANVKASDTFRKDWKHHTEDILKNRPPPIEQKWRKWILAAKNFDKSHIIAQ